MGGFDITYPSYESYQNDEIMQKEISWQNQAILAFAQRNNLSWSKFDTEWISEHFEQSVPNVVTSDVKSIDDIRVAILK